MTDSVSKNLHIGEGVAKISIRNMSHCTFSASLIPWKLLIGQLGSPGKYREES
ncbi:Hypothetical protein FKW44_007406 [Caligus rogercresseyi]|uniref:Uncharacterized protein n=1 Tax=Caligus rogercresseyi TaxID=217165 RepID=A0A7T8QTK1_CALRO|nr:Hypothetical protein FKW44_007406 [Caligus rogercresseyi]